MTTTIPSGQTTSTSSSPTGPAPAANPAEKPVAYRQLLPEIMATLARVHTQIDEAGLDKKLQHILMLRASQINGCGFCVRLHLKEAREDGVSQQQLDELVIWAQSSAFSPAEKAALAYTEAMTRLLPDTAWRPLRAALRQHFDDRQIALLTMLHGMINFWNRMAISQH